jgi:hypothetical protein
MASTISFSRTARAPHAGVTIRTGLDVNRTVCPIVKKGLTASVRQAKVDIMKEYTEADLHAARLRAIPEAKRTLSMWDERIAAAEGAGDRLAIAEAARHHASVARFLEYAEANEARYEGSTWEEIGARFGISKQAAQQRFGKPYKEENGSK